MISGHYNLKYFLYKVVLAFYELTDLGRLHPARERNIRALQTTVEFIDEHLPDAVGFGTQRELLEYILPTISDSGYYLEFGVYIGGSLRHLAKRKPTKTIHGFDSFEGLPDAWSGFNLGKRAFDVRGKLPKVPRNVKLHKGLVQRHTSAMVSAEFLAPSRFLQR